MDRHLPVRIQWWLHVVCRAVWHFRQPHRQRLHAQGHGHEVHADKGRGLREVGGRLQICWVMAVCLSTLLYFQYHKFCLKTSVVLKMLQFAESWLHVGLHIYLLNISRVLRIQQFAESWWYVCSLCCIPNIKCKHFCGVENTTICWVMVVCLSHLLYSQHHKLNTSVALRVQQFAESWRYVCLLCSILNTTT